MPDMGLNLQPFTNYDGENMWVEDSQVGCKAVNDQSLMMLINMEAIWHNSDSNILISCSGMGLRQMWDSCVSCE
jgi:hypothetical protein